MMIAYNTTKTQIRNIQNSLSYNFNRQAECDNLITSSPVALNPKKKNHALLPFVLLSRSRPISGVATGRVQDEGGSGSSLAVDVVLPMPFLDGQEILEEWGGGNTGE
jgi:hypothetical protein